LANAIGSAGIAQAGSERAGHETGVGTVETDSEKFEGEEAFMNVKLLRKVKKHILEEPKRFIMGDWVVRKEYPDQQLFDDDGKPRTFAKCGTAACIAGWTMLLSKVDPDKVDSYSGAASKLLGLKERFSPLFYTDQWPAKYEDAYVNAKTPAGRARVAARRIEHFIKTNGAE
jgi:hypothetical protein